MKTGYYRGHDGTLRELIRVSYGPRNGWCLYRDMATGHLESIRNFEFMKWAVVYINNEAAGGTAA